jgi:hypothetical protein
LKLIRMCCFPSPSCFIITNDLLRNVSLASD